MIWVLFFKGGEHLCFLGSGRNEEDQYTHMVVASFLQKHTQYVSLLTGGYMAVHSYFSDNIGEFLQDHNPKHCIVCAPKYVPTVPQNNGKSAPSIDIFGKISAAMKSKSAEVKEKLIDYIVNPSNSPSQEFDVSGKDKAKRYKDVAPVFSIDDDHDSVTPIEVSIEMDLILVYNNS